MIPSPWSMNSGPAYLSCDDVPDYGIYMPRRWPRFFQAKLDAGGLAKVALVGDSIMRGYWSSNLDTKGWAGLLRAELQAKYGDGGSGFKGMCDTTSAQWSCQGRSRRWCKGRGDGMTVADQRCGGRMRALAL
jgi:hypothetical protein